MKQQIPHPLISIIPLLVLIVMIVTVMKMLPNDALSGASQISMLIATTICVALSMSIYRIKWQVFEDSIKTTIGETSVSILILLLIGVMSSTWMISGVVPTDILRRADYHAIVLPAMRLHHFFTGVGNDRHIVDNDSHNRHRLAWHWQCARHTRTIYGRCHYIWRIFR